MSTVSWIAPTTGFNVSSQLVKNLLYHHDFHLISCNRNRYQRDIKISICKVCRSGKVTSWHSWGAQAGCNPEAAGWRGSELPHVHWSSLGESSRTGAHTDAWGTHEEYLQHRIECDLPDTLQCNVKALPNRVTFSNFHMRHKQSLLPRWG